MVPRRLVVPCWFLVLVFAALTLAGWRWADVGGNSVALCVAAGFLTAFVPLALSARRGRRITNALHRRFREMKIEAAIREGRIGPGMTMAQVTQVLPGWSPRRTSLTTFAGAEWEQWEFRPADSPPGAAAPQQPVVALFRDGQVAFSNYGLDQAAD